MSCARTALEQARTIDPANLTVQDMLMRVDVQLRQRRAATAPAAPATNPAAAAGAATPPVAVAGGGDPTSVPPDSTPPAKRMVTPDEINQIRQTEWREGQPVRVRIDQETLKRAASLSDMSIADFNRLTQTQKAWRILTTGKADLAKGVHILSDPPAIEEFKKTANRSLLTGCATSNCHGGGKGGNLALFPSESDPAVYSNFLILSTYAKKIEKVKYLMIERAEPTRSLLLNYMLAPELSDVPHPKTPNYHGVARTKLDLKYASALAWIQQALNPVQPVYTIDLSKPPADKANPAGTPPPGTPQ